MRCLKMACWLFVLASVPARAAEEATSLDQVVDRMILHEKALAFNLGQYSPLVETYIQNVRPDERLGAVPVSDAYFLGRAELTKGIEVHSLTQNTGKARHIFGGLGSFFSPSMQYLPDGFLQMIFIDSRGFDRRHYKITYVRREFLGEVRCLVFDVTPLPKSGKGRFVGRIWVEDQDYTIVRFNGGYAGSSYMNYYFHFDSWRVNAGPGLWLPAYIYSEESDVQYALLRRLQFKAQTRLWDYNLSHTRQELELSRVLRETPTPARDTSETAKDYSPVQAQRMADRQAEENVVEYLERIGLLAPHGDVDKVLETVVNNLEVSNNLEIQPEVRCRVLLTTSLESFTAGHSIVLSRSLIDVLPDEASLAAILAQELANVVLGHSIDDKYAFADRMIFRDLETFHNLSFHQDPKSEAEANQKALELLKNSPYKDALGNASLFLQALDARGRQLPHLISPHLGNRVSGVQELAKLGSPLEMQKLDQIAALPLGSRIKVDPWDDHIEMIKSKPVALVSAREKMPFEVTAFYPYLTRQSIQGAAAAAKVELKAEPPK